MHDPQSINLHEILTYWGFSDSEIIKYFNPDSPRIIAKIRNGNQYYILKGIPDKRDGKLREEQTIYGNVLAHQFLGNQKGIAPRIFPIKCNPPKYYLKKGDYWFYLIEFIEGRQMQETPDDEFMLGKLAKKLHSLKGYSFPSAHESKQRFYEWFGDKPFKAAFDMLLYRLPDFEKYDRCMIHTDLGPHNTIVRTNGEAVLVDLDDSGIGSRYLDLGWPFIMQFVEHTDDMKLSYRFDLALAFLKGYYGTMQIPEKEYDLLWQGAVYMHISYMQSYGPDAVDSLWKILQFGLDQKPALWKMIKNT